MTRPHITAHLLAWRETWPSGPPSVPTSRFPRESVAVRVPSARRILPSGCCGDPPARLDPASLLQPEERRIQRALIQVEDAFRHLEDPLREAESVLRSHCGERP